MSVIKLDRSRPFSVTFGGGNGVQYHQDGHDYDAEYQRIGDIETPQLSLIGKEMLNTMKTLAESAPDGCFVEVGVYKGGSAQVLYSLGRSLFLYDTFEGMPNASEIDQHPLGDLADCSYEEVCNSMPDATVIKGVFPASIVKMPPVAFVHADADQYESTAAICRVFPALMANGGMILFDDYRALPGCVKAVDEAFPNREILSDGRALVRFNKVKSEVPKKRGRPRKE